MESRGREKYESEPQYLAVKLRRSVIRQLIRPLTRWKRLDNPREGYSIVIGCNVPLVRMISCNLRFLSQQNLEHAEQIFIVLDRPRDQMPDDIEDAVRQRFPSLPLRFLYYGRLQSAICGAIGWPWVQCWLSWALGIARVGTRYAVLHDFDAMLLRPGILEERYQAIRARQHQYVGARFYDGNGVTPEDGFATTFELVFDAAHVRNTLRPIDLFSHVTRYKGRRVDLDTFLYAQSLGGTASVLPILEEDMVHPSQLICQFSDFLEGRRGVRKSNNLLLVPYFLYAGDEPDVLRSVTAELERNVGSTISYFGKPLDLSGLDPDLLRWLAKQAFRVESAIAGDVRPEVSRYFTAIDRFVARAAGRETSLNVARRRPGDDGELERDFPEGETERRLERTTAGIAVEGVGMQDRSPQPRK